MAQSLAVIDGALLIDKPEGITSADVLRVIKRAFHPEKIGHSGTLDPLATGLMVVLLGRATRLSSLFLEGGKSYEGQIRLGTSTDTDDREGQIVFEDEGISEKRREWNEATLERLKKQFTGKLLQRPPAYSALKVGGKKSYELARRGEVVEHPERLIEVYSLHLEFCGEREIFYRVDCSKGTYVRSLARDIGKALGTVASIQSLRRISSGQFRVGQALQLAQVTEYQNRLEELSAQLVPLEALVCELPRVDIDTETRTLLLQGKQDILRQLIPNLFREGTKRPIALFHQGALSGLLDYHEEAGEWKIRFMIPLEK